MVKVITAFAYKYAAALASPWTVLALVLVSFTALPQTIIATIQHGDITILIGWFSQTHVQLVALAVLAFTQAVEARKAHIRGLAAEQRADEMYAWQKEQHEERMASLSSLHGKVDALSNDGESS